MILNPFNFSSYKILNSLEKYNKNYKLIKISKFFDMLYNKIEYLYDNKKLLNINNNNSIDILSDRITLKERLIDKYLYQFYIDNKNKFVWKDKIYYNRNYYLLMKKKIIRRPIKLFKYLYIHKNIIHNLFSGLKELEKEIISSKSDIIDKINELCNLPPRA